MKYCVDCTHSFIPLTAPKYRRCRQAEGPSDREAALCGSMRRSTGACSPDAALYEAIMEEVSDG